MAAGISRLALRGPIRASMPSADAPPRRDASANARLPGACAHASHQAPELCSSTELPSPRAPWGPATGGTGEKHAVPRPPRPRVSACGSRAGRGGERARARRRVSGENRRARSGRQRCRRRGPGIAVVMGHLRGAGRPCAGGREREQPQRNPLRAAERDHLPPANFPFFPFRRSHGRHERVWRGVSVATRF